MRVLLVGGTTDDRAAIAGILKSQPDMVILASVGTGDEALVVLAESSPDILLMDAETPLVGGVEAPLRIMELYPVPIVLVTAPNGMRPARPIGEADLPDSAVARITLPSPGADYERQATELLQTTRLMAEVRVVRRWSRLRRPSTDTGSAPAARPRAQLRVLAVGASTGGPAALQALLAGLPSHFRVPVLVVHHISPGFLLGLVDWLSESTQLHLSIATHGVQPLPGCGYFAPDGFHLGVDARGHLKLSEGEPEYGMKPSVSYLFRSVARVYGSEAAGVLLTGMGRDGAEELAEMRSRGAVTFAQDRESSAIYGMPGEAARLGAATFILPPEMIAAQLGALAARGGVL